MEVTNGLRRHACSNRRWGGPYAFTLVNAIVIWRRRGCQYSLGTGNFAGGAMVSDGRGLVGLLHRADWARLSVSAEVSDGSSLLVAPGKRYRCENAEYMTGCDGVRAWALFRDEDDLDRSVHWIRGPEAPLRRLLCPAWLLEDSVLEVLGRGSACGRDALDVAVIRRPGQPGGGGATDGWPAPLRILVDAELGILLRIAEPGREPEVIELVSADFDPVIDPGMFVPPPGSRIAEDAGEVLGGALSPAKWAATTAAGLAAGALGAWIRYSPGFQPGRRSATTCWTCCMPAARPSSPRRCTSGPASAPWPRRRRHRPGGPGSAAWAC